MSDDLSQLLWLVAAVAEHGLSAQIITPQDAPAYVHVCNEINSRLSEDVRCTRDGTLVTAWGYELGAAVDARSAAARLGYLLAGTR